ncbi:hypothetical protein [Acetobacterium sp.]|uniref:hypothetical protein n=1 Tax=Acetobacterium sp. TaxID=1872094 RepID=UPI003592FBFF
MSTKSSGKNIKIVKIERCELIWKSLSKRERGSSSKEIETDWKNYVDKFSEISSRIGFVLAVGAFFTCILVGHVLETKSITDEVKRSSPFKREKLFIIMIKYLAPLCIIGIQISSILEALGVIKY